MPVLVAIARNASQRCEPAVARPGIRSLRMGELYGRPLIELARVEVDRAIRVYTPVISNDGQIKSR